MIQTGTVTGPRFFFLKSLLWKYESEFRLIRLTTHRELDSSEIDSFAVFPPSLIQSIYTGIYIESSDMALFKKALNGEDYRHVHLFEMKRNGNEFCFEPKELNRPW
jgi:hypothetical protein